MASRALRYSKNTQPIQSSVHDPTILQVITSSPTTTLNPDAAVASTPVSLSSGLITDSNISPASSRTSFSTPGVTTSQTGPSSISPSKSSGLRMSRNSSMSPASSSRHEDPEQQRRPTRAVKPTTKAKELAASGSKLYSSLKLDQTEASREQSLELDAKSGNTPSQGEQEEILSLLSTVPAASTRSKRQQSKTQIPAATSLISDNAYGLDYEHNQRSSIKPSKSHANPVNHVDSPKISTKIPLRSAKRLCVEEADDQINSVTRTSQPADISAARRSLRSIPKHHNCNDETNAPVERGLQDTQTMKAKCNEPQINVKQARHRAGPTKLPSHKLENTNNEEAPRINFTQQKQRSDLLDTSQNDSHLGSAQSSASRFVPDQDLSAEKVHVQAEGEPASKECKGRQKIVRLKVDASKSAPNVPESIRSQGNRFPEQDNTNSSTKNWTMTAPPDTQRSASVRAAPRCTGGCLDPAERFYALTVIEVEHRPRTQLDLDNALAAYCVCSANTSAAVPNPKLTLKLNFSRDKALNNAKNLRRAAENEIDDSERNTNMEIEGEE